MGERTGIGRDRPHGHTHTHKERETEIERESHTCEKRKKEDLEPEGTVKFRSAVFGRAILSCCGTDVEPSRRAVASPAVSLCRRARRQSSRCAASKTPTYPATTSISAPPSPSGSGVLFFPRWFFFSLPVYFVSLAVTLRGSFFSRRVDCNIFVAVLTSILSLSLSL